jgi:hypothetical protein
VKPSLTERCSLSFELMPFASTNPGGHGVAAPTDREIQMSRTLLRAGLFGLGIIAIMSSPAVAKKVDLPGTRSKEYMKDLCGQVGGNYSEGQGQYGCTSNCGQQGQTSDACGINCSEETNKCYGWTPGRKRPPRSATGILRPPGGGVKALPK